MDQADQRMDGVVAAVGGQRFREGVANREIIALQLRHGQDLFWRRLDHRGAGERTPAGSSHVLHPDGKAVVYLSGKVVNAGVPAKVLRAAQAWIDANAKDVRREWSTMNNPRRR